MVFFFSIFRCNMMDAVCNIIGERTLLLSAVYCSFPTLPKSLLPQTLLNQ